MPLHSGRSYVLDISSTNAYDLALIPNSCPCNGRPPLTPSHSPSQTPPNRLSPNVHPRSYLPRKTMQPQKVYTRELNAAEVAPIESINKMQRVQLHSTQSPRRYA
jgi:hypothetical protein